MEFIGQRMRKARQEARIKQKDAARRLGMSPSELSRIERSDPRARRLRDYEIVRASQLYNRSADWLLGLSERPYLRADLAWRLSELPAELARQLIETQIYVLHEFLDMHELLPHQSSSRRFK